MGVIIQNVIVFQTLLLFTSKEQIFVARKLLVISIAF